MFLSDILVNSKVEDLKNIARNHDFRGYSKLKKGELVEFIIKNAISEESFKKCFLYATDSEVAIFKQCLTSQLVINDEVASGYMYLYGHCYYAINQFNQVIVPEDVREAFAQYDTEELWNERARIQLILKYIKAAVHLYGIIPAEKLAEIISEQTKEVITKKELVELFETAMVKRPINVVLNKGNFVDRVVMDEKNGYETLLKAQGEKEYYIPHQAEFVKYVSRTYFEQNAEYLDMKRFIIKNIVSNLDVADELCKQIRVACSLGMGLSKASEAINASGVPIYNEQHVERLIAYIADLYNTTRMKSNRGFTPNELNPNNKVAMNVLKSMPTMKRQETNAPKKIGRNDTCPCGSGKKYKHCCGR